MPERRCGWEGCTTVLRDSKSRCCGKHHVTLLMLAQEAGWSGSQFLDRIARGNIPQMRRRLWADMEARLSNLRKETEHAA